MTRRTWLTSVGAAIVASRLGHARTADTLEPLASYRGPVSVAMSFVWRSNVVANAIATSMTPHILANDAVSELRVTGTLGARRLSLVSDAYDAARHVYTTAPIPARDLASLLDRHAALSVDLRFELFSFFDVLLAQMTRTDATLHNVATPDDSGDILDTFDHLAGDKPTITYRSATHRLDAVACKLVTFEVAPQPAPRPPAVTLRFELDVAADDARKLVAMDWSSLAQFGTRTSPQPPRIHLWSENVVQYLAHQTDMVRAERFRTTLAERHAGKPPETFADDLRRDLDAHLITANRWGEPREDPRKERHQALLSDVFGALHTSAWPASPSALSRALTKKYRLDLDEAAALTLQYGTGFCGEHCRTTFSIVRAAMAGGASQVDSVLLCGNANIDHSFVIINLPVTHVVLTRATSTVNTRVKIGDDIRVFDLRAAIAKNGERVGYVIDPYLDPSMISARADGLLRALHNRNKRKRQKDTDFLLFRLQHPQPPTFAVEDIRDRPSAERERRVKNV